MKVKILKKLSYFIEYEALEDGSIITSAVDHPGPRDMVMRIFKGQKFQLSNDYVLRNRLEVQESEGSR